MCPASAKVGQRSCDGVRRDAEVEFTEFLSDFLGHAKAHSKDAPSCSVHGLAALFETNIAAGRESGLAPKNWLLPYNAAGHRSYRSKHELFLPGTLSCASNTFELGQHGAIGPMSGNTPGSTPSEPAP